MSNLPRLSDLPAATSLGELLEQLGRLETAQLDFKRDSSRLRDLIPAMAMTDGGLILLGIDDDRTVFGFELTQKNQDRITRASKDVGVDIQLTPIRDLGPYPAAA